jgi:hypothetical protein
MVFLIGLFIVSNLYAIIFHLSRTVFTREISFMVALFMHFGN